MGFTIARIIAAILLFWALDRHPYGYYTLLRFVVCGVTAYGVYYALELQKNGWAWAFGIIAVLFNPLIPIHLKRDIWAIIDLAVAILLLLSIFLLRKSHSGQVDIKSLTQLIENKEDTIDLRALNQYSELPEKKAIEPDKGMLPETKCPNCKKKFIPWRKNQKFCSSACRQKYYQRGE
jgi:hypothetical protein